jgi:hypothetical protein
MYEGFSPDAARPAVNPSIRIGVIMLHIFSIIVRCPARANLSMRLRALDGTAVTTLCALVPEKVRPRHATSHFGRPRHHLRGRKPVSGAAAGRWASFRLLKLSCPQQLQN